jgi:CelD/BcsL family acetyltransferase involved in cellulose biosynthesis
VELTTIDPRTTPEWETFVSTHADATVFHTTAWCRVLTDTYRYRPRYIVSREAGRITGGIPLMAIDSWLTSRRLIGLPFSDNCAPLLPDDAKAAELLLRSAREEADRVRASRLQLRGHGAPDMEACGYTNGTTFLQHIIDLAPNADFERTVHSSARRAIRKAEKEGVTVRESAGLADVRRFYELMVLTRRKHGLLPQPWRFYKNIHRHVLSHGAGKLLLAEYGGEVVAGDLLLRFRDQLMYKFNASDPRFLHLRPNNLLLWEAMRSGAASGCRTLDLGRCEEENEGLRRFKLLWGSRETTLSYYHYPQTARGSALLSARPARAALGLYARHAPAFALQFAGAMLYHNFG